MFLPPDNGLGNNGAEPTLQQQRQRRRMFQTGLFICMMLLLLDSSNEDARARAQERAKQNSTSLERMDPNLSDMVNAQSVYKNKIPGNVSGLYSGIWNLVSEQNATSEMSFHLPDAYLEGKTGNNTLQESAGLGIIQIQSRYMTGSRDVDLIQGVFRAFNGMRTNTRKAISRSVIFSFQGLFFHKTGTLVAAGNLPSTTKHVSVIFKSPGPKVKFKTEPGGGKETHDDVLHSSEDKLLGEEDAENGESAGRRQLVGVKAPPNSLSHSRSSISQSSSLFAYYGRKIIQLFVEMPELEQHYPVFNRYYSEQPTVSKGIFTEGVLDFTESTLSWSSDFQHRALVETEVLGSILQSEEGGAAWAGAAGRVPSADASSDGGGGSGSGGSGGGGRKRAQVANYRRGKRDAALAALAAQGAEVAVTFPVDSPRGWARPPGQHPKLRDCAFLLQLEAGPRVKPLGDAGRLASKWAGRLEGTVRSPNCGLSLRLGAQALRVDWEDAYRKAVNYSIMMTIVCLLQLVLLFKQLHFSQNQAAAARVSMLGLGQQAVLDALLCLLHLLLCAAWQPLFTAFASVSFFKLVTFCVFEMRYLVLIFQSRQPQSFFADGPAALRRGMAQIHGRFYAALFAAVILAYALKEYFGVYVILIYSYWVPQIICNAIRNTNKPFHLAYLWGITSLRLVLPLYFLGCPKNFLMSMVPRAEIDQGLCVVLVVWTAVQVVVLLLQDKERLGPRFFVPKRFLPPRYDYRRPLPDSLRGGGGGGAAAGDGEDGEDAPLNPLHARDGGGATARGVGGGGGGDAHPLDEEAGTLTECAICQAGVAPGAADDYMLTPCDHLFHAACLAQWMAIKMECPTCRAQLPQP